LTVEILEKRDLPSFFGPALFDADQGPSGLAVGDLRGDGHLDIVTGNAAHNTVSVLLGNGDRTFQRPVNYATGGLGNEFVTLAQLRPGGPVDIISASNDDYFGTLSVFLGVGDGTFRSAVQYHVAEQEIPFAVVAGDFGGDGIPDLVTLDDGVLGPMISLFAGRGDGTFGSPINFPLAHMTQTVYSLTAGDFAGNGHLDLAVGTIGGVDVLLGNEDGTFQPPVFYSADPGFGVASVLAQDLTGTGKLDLVTANSGANTVSVLPGHGDGTFGPATNYSVAGRSPVSVAVGHLRAGGPLDLVAANLDSDSVSVLPGNGDGTFGPATAYAAGGPSRVVAADFTGTGVDDIVAANGSGATVSVLANQGDGTLPTPAPLPLNLPFSVATADFRHVGIRDLVTLEYANGIENMVVLLGNGDGSFQAPRLYPVGPGADKVVVGDFNGDGNADVAVSGPPDNFVAVFLGNGDGTFQDPLIIPAVSTARAQVHDFAVGHFHDPNILDLVTLDSGNKVNVVLGNGDGTFQMPVTYDIGGSLPGAVTVADINQDGRADIVVSTDAGVQLLRGNGDGTFQSPAPFTLGFPVAVADLNGDGIPDLVLSTHAGISVALGNGDGTYQTPQVIGPVTGALIVGDFTGSGILDLAQVSTHGGSVSILPGNGDGTFQAPIRAAVGAEPRALVAGDFNGNGLLDLAVANRNSLSVLFNDGNWPVHPVAALSPYHKSAHPSALQALASARLTVNHPQPASALAHSSVRLAASTEVASRAEEGLWKGVVDHGLQRARGRTGAWPGSSPDRGPTASWTARKTPGHRLPSDAGKNDQHGPCRRRANGKRVLRHRGTPTCFFVPKGPTHAQAKPPPSYESFAPAPAPAGARGPLPLKYLYADRPGPGHLRHRRQQPGTGGRVYERRQF
jgi:hypothetical protein